MDGGKRSSLEARLIITPNHERRDHEEGGGGGWFIIREEILEEGKKQVVLAGPLIAVSLLQYCLQVISIMFVGHLGELPLASASLATSFASVSGFSVLVTIAQLIFQLSSRVFENLGALIFISISGPTTLVGSDGSMASVNHIGKSLFF